MWAPVAVKRAVPTLPLLGLAISLGVAVALLLRAGRR